MKVLPFLYTTTTTHGETFTVWQYRAANGTLYRIEREADESVVYEVNMFLYQEVPNTTAAEWLAEYSLCLEEPVIS